MLLTLIPQAALYALWATVIAPLLQRALDSGGLLAGGGASLVALAFLCVHCAARGCLFVRGFMLFHDAGHNALFASHAANRFATWPLSFLVLTPADWPAKHRRHHGAAGNLGQAEAPWSDTVFVTTRTRARMKPAARAFHDAARWPPVFFTLAPLVVWFFRYRVPVQLDTFSGRLAAAPHNMVNTLGGGALIALLWHLLPLGGYAAACELVGAYLGAAAGLALFHVQHVYNPPDGTPAYVVTEGWTVRDAGLLGSSHLLVREHLGRAGAYVTLGIEYHHIHHFNTRVPCYLLDRCHDEAPPGMWDAVTQLGPKDAWRALWNTHFDEETSLYVPIGGA